jgi:hypothetical protein
VAQGADKYQSLTDSGWRPCDASLLKSWTELGAIYSTSGSGRQYVLTSNLDLSVMWHAKSLSPNEVISVTRRLLRDAVTISKLTGVEFIRDATIRLEGSKEKDQIMKAEKLVARLSTASKRASWPITIGRNENRIIISAAKTKRAVAWEEITNEDW